MARAKDIPLEVGVGRPTSVLKLLEELKPAFDRSRAHYAVAERNERFLNGNQWVGLNARDELVPMRVMPWEPIVTKNVLRNLWHTWASRVLKQGASVRAYPHEATPGDIARAYIANAIIDYQRQIQDLDALNMEAALLVQAHTAVGLLATWDPFKGRHKAKRPVLDEFGTPAVDGAGEPVLEDFDDVGDVHVELLTIFDFVTDGAEQVENSQWLLVRRYLDPYDAEARLRDAGYPQKVTLTERKNQADKAQKGQEVVEAFELWHKPGARFKDGLYATVINGCVVDFAPKFPYAHGELPISVWKVQDKRGSPWGESHVNDAVPQQQRLNEVLAALARWTDLTRQIRGVGKSAIIDQWDTEPDGFIRDDSGEPDKALVFISPGAVPKDLYELVDRYERGVAECFGVNEVVASGGAPDQTKSARQLAYISELDGQKLAIPKRNLDRAMLRLHRQILKLWQQFVAFPRLVRIVGEDRAADAEFFEGADIAGVDVWLETTPASERSRAAAGVDAEQSAAAGYLAPDRAAQRRDTGLLSTLDETQVRQEVSQLVEQAKQGQPVQANPAHDPQVAQSAIRSALEMAVGTPGEMPLRALLQQYQDLARQMQAEPTQGQQPQKAGVSARAEKQQSLGGLEQ